MDTHHAEPPMPVAEAVRRVVDQVAAGDDAVLSGGFEASLALDGVADELAGRRIRVLRAATPASNKLSLSGLLAQVTGRPDLDGHDDEVLEHGFKVLTVPGDACDGIALLVDGAEALQGSALLYLQMVGRAAPMLRFVFAGDGGLPDLHDDKMAGLRTRLAARPALTLAGTSSAALLPQAGLPEAGLAPSAGLPSMPPGPASGSAPLVAPLLPNPPPPGSRLLSPAVQALSEAGVVPPGPSVLASTSVPALADRVAAAASARPPGPATLPAETPAQAGHRRIAVWARVGAAMAACLALGVLVGRRNGPGEVAPSPGPELVPRVADAVPASPPAVQPPATSPVPAPVVAPAPGERPGGKPAPSTENVAGIVPPMPSRQNATILAFQGPILNETMDQRGQLSLGIQRWGPTNVTARFHASAGLIGSGDLTGTMNANGRITASGRLMMGRNAFDATIVATLTGDKLEGTVTFVRTETGSTARGRFNLSRS